MPDGPNWAKMHAQPRHHVAGLAARHVPANPGVYAVYGEGVAVYVGVATGAGGLRRRIGREHLNTGLDLSRSSFRRNVGQMLGAFTVAEARQRPTILTQEQVKVVNVWTAGCEIAWIVTSDGQEALNLENVLKLEGKPRLTRR